MSGALVAIVGPSGAGKDTLIAHAKAAREGDPAFLFVRRMVTRGANAFEDHGSLTEEAFADGCAQGAFALAWRAHGLGYAVPGGALQAVEAGRVAICNLSRRAIAEARQRFPRVSVVLVTAPPAVLAARIAGRGRESADAVAARLGRAAEGGDLAADLTIVNDGAAEAAAARLIDHLDALAGFRATLRHGT